MNRRQVRRFIAAGIFAIGAVVATAALSYRARWSRPPSITVISAAGDSRIPLVMEAVDYWNRVFLELGLTFRFGIVSFVADSVPDVDVLALGPTWRPTLLASLTQYSGDILVILSDANFISLAAPRGRRVVVAIKGQSDARMTQNINALTDQRCLRREA